jgi:hypothetical protein
VNVRRQLVLRIIGTNGETIHEHKVPLSKLGPHENSQATMQLRATIEVMPPTIVDLGAVNLSPWGEGF